MNIKKLIVLIALIGSSSIFSMDNQSYWNRTTNYVANTWRTSRMRHNLEAFAEKQQVKKMRRQAHQEAYRAYKQGVTSQQARIDRLTQKNRQAEQAVYDSYNPLVREDNGTYNIQSSKVNTNPYNAERMKLFSKTEFRKDKIRDAQKMQAIDQAGLERTRPYAQKPTLRSL